MRAGSELRYPQNTGKMASLNPKFSPGQSTLLSKTLNYKIVWTATLRCHTKVSPLAKSQSPSIFLANAQYLCEHSTFQNA